jgi:diguanylate cyclase (GGDEF)-like protein
MAGPERAPVSKSPATDVDPRVSANQELTQLQGQVEATRAMLIRLLQDVVEVEGRLSTAQGPNLMSSDQAAQLLEANEQLVLTALRAQTDAQTATQALADVSGMADLDALTQLPNRLLLHDRFARAIASARRNETPLALLFIDLDHFKQINDEHGHAVGDAALKLAAQRMTGVVRAVDTVSRHGGDEFVILLTEVSQRSDAALIAAKVQAALGESAQVGRHEIHLSASIGIAVFPDDGDAADTLIDRADAAMYCAKRHGPGSIAFHGQAPVGTASEPNPSHAVLKASLERHERTLAEQGQRHVQLREANEHLVLAALSAQELQGAADRARRRQADFMTLVAQELNNPLAPIRLATAMLGRARNDEPLLPRVQGIIDLHVEKMSQLIGAFDDVSRATATALQPEYRIVDMTDLVGVEARSWRATLEARRQRFTVKLGTEPCPVRGDPLSLAQIVGNLLDNASKFTPEHGEIVLTLQPRSHDLVLTVTDNGIGITAHALPEVFEPFTQDIHGIGFNGVGLGIGLTVVRELVEGLGGDIVAHSPGRGQGSRFVVTLPLATSNNPGAGAQAPAIDQPG